jgi:hypothetical protein
MQHPSGFVVHGGPSEEQSFRNAKLCAVLLLLNCKYGKIDCCHFCSYTPLPDSLLFTTRQEGIRRQKFLHILVEASLQRKPTSDLEPPRFKAEDPPDATINEILNAPIDELWDALKAILADDRKQDLLIVIDGLDQVEHQRVEFIKRIREFIIYLQERNVKAKALLTSRPQDKIKELLYGLPYIEYDKERKGLATSYLITLN